MTVTPVVEPATSTTDRPQSVPIAWQLILLGVVTIAVFSQPFLRLIEVREVNVYAHVEYARKLSETHVLYPGHFLFHLLTAVVHMIGISWLQANFVVQMAARVGLAAIILTLFRRSLGGSNRPARVAAGIAMTMAVMAASAVSFPSWPRGNYYLGYLVPNIYVSQTFVVLQPLAALTFVEAVRVFFGAAGRRTGGQLLTMGALALVSTLAKPSFVMVLLPSVAVLLVATFKGDVLRSRRVVLAFVALVVPALAGMLWIYLSTYLAVQGLHVSEGSGVRIAPFEVMGYFEGLFTSRVGLWLGGKFLLSLLFPAAVALAYRRRVGGDPRCRLAWLQFAFGAIFVYFFAEAPAFQAGNFVWSGDIAIFILFLVSALVLVEETMARPIALDRRARLTAAACYGTLLLHVAAGYGMYWHPVVT
jgi:hypothetical protein